MPPAIDDSISWCTMRDYPGRLAAFMLDHLDGNPDRLAIFEVPRDALAVGIDIVERVFNREYEQAKTERPNLCIDIVPGGDDFPDVAWLVAIHEHDCVRGPGARGCDHTPEKE